MFMLHGRLGAKPGKRDALLALFTDESLTASMPGCWLYLVAVDETDEDGVWVTEVWDSEEAHAASLQLDHVKALIAQAMPILDPTGYRQQRLTTRAGIPG